MRKIVFSDYDGTLDTSEEDIQRNIESIGKFQNNGNLFVIATGRSYLDLKRKLDLYPVPFDYLILNHGGVILDRNERVVDACLISKEVALSILAEVKSDKNIEHIVYFDVMQKSEVTLPQQFTKIALEMKDEVSARDLSKKLNQQWNKFIKSYVIVTKEYYLVEIISIKTDKGEAIEKILKIENISVHAVYTIGDGSNDVEMILKYDGYGMVKSDSAVYAVTKKLCNTVAELIDTLQ